MLSFHCLTVDFLMYRGHPDTLQPGCFPKGPGHHFLVLRGCGHGPSVVTLAYLFQLTAFGGFLKYTVSYAIPVETVDGDLMSHADVIIKVVAFTLFCCRVEGLSWVTVYNSVWQGAHGQVAVQPGFASSGHHQD